MLHHWQMAYRHYSPMLMAIVHQIYYCQQMKAPVLFFYDCLVISCQGGFFFVDANGIACAAPSLCIVVWLGALGTTDGLPFKVIMNGFLQRHINFMQNLVFFSLVGTGTERHEAADCVGQRWRRCARSDWRSNVDRCQW
jgi:hypothetical protein